MEDFGFDDFLKNNSLLFNHDNDHILVGRDWLIHYEQYLNQWLENQPLTEQLNHITKVIYHRSLGIDYLIKTYIKQYFCESICLLAIGGYGRLELLPKSDIDLLIIYDDCNIETQLSNFNTFLWDIGLKPAIHYYHINSNHQPTDLSLIKDVSHATALFDTRFIIGRIEWQQLPKQWLKDNWSYQEFYQKKIAEKNQRQHQHRYTAQHLEPNIKTGVGGLRAIQLLIWLLQARSLFFDHFQQFDNSDDSPYSMVALSHNFLNDDEKKSLKEALCFFWLIRHHLHKISKKSEERLLFSYQKNIADLLYKNNGNNPNKNAEQLMHQYFKHAMNVHCLVEVLYELLDNHDDYNETIIQEIFPFFIIKNGQTTQIKISDAQLFLKNPSYLLLIFLTMAEHHTKKIAPNTLRYLKKYANLIDDDYSNNQNNQAIFLKILSNKNQLANLLNLMAKYGILGRYLPAFDAITGLMQYDMFHRYTVDNHTLRLLAIFGQFAGFDDWLPSELVDDTIKQNRHFWQLYGIYGRLTKPHLLHLSALFHDIAKGQEGDHAINGAILAEAFCQTHGYNDEDTKLVSWLVREHLTMSHIAQKKDINDPIVLLDFANLVGDDDHLDYLYLLTIADMNATNHQLWNDWRATLLFQLYQATKPLLTQKVSPQAILNARKTDAKMMIDCAAVDEFWAKFDEDYFGKDNADVLAWHANAILGNNEQHNLPSTIIKYRPHPDTALNAYELMVYCPSRIGLFYHIIQVLDNLHYNILKASASTSSDDMALDGFVILSRTAPIQDMDFDDKLKELTQVLHNSLSNHVPPAPKNTPHAFMPIYQSMPKSTHFAIRATVDVKVSNNHEATLTVVAKDRPRLLADITRVLFDYRVMVKSANVMTLGVRAEDSFVIWAEDGFDDKNINELKKAVLLVVNKE